MQLTINGEPRDVPDGLNLRALIEHLGIKPELVAAQHNERIVGRDAQTSVTLAEGDIVELIRIVGGG